jgi:hypothetical protein
MIILEAENPLKDYSLGEMTIGTIKAGDNNRSILSFDQSLLILTQIKNTLLLFMYMVVHMLNLSTTHG